MKPFEVLGSDGHIHFHYDNWYRWRNETLSSHPGEGKWRFDLDLRYPRDNLEDVPVTNSQVHSGRFDNHTCFYECDDWSTIYDHYESQGDSMFRLIVESQNPEPLWGERITLLSTSTYFKCEPWGRNAPNQFAFFRGQYWQVNYSELLHHEFPAGVGYPLRDGGPFGVPRRQGHPLTERLTGHTANQFMDVGYFYAPYVPVVNTPVVIDTEAFDNRRGIMTRYGARLLQEGLVNYGRLSLDPEFKLDWKKYGF